MAVKAAGGVLCPVTGLHVWLGPVMVAAQPVTSTVSVSPPSSFETARSLSSGAHSRDPLAPPQDAGGDSFTDSEERALARSLEGWRAPRLHPSFETHRFRDAPQSLTENEVESFQHLAAGIVRIENLDRCYESA